ncbi:hypothetical protein KSS87_017291 [Heliosperma pusillum]|nr:hypothetical protein KSS87_017291 [Heliosperma pusillum]
MVEKWGIQVGVVGALFLSVASSVSIVICNKALMSNLGFKFAPFQAAVLFVFGPLVDKFLTHQSVFAYTYSPLVLGFIILSCLIAVLVNFSTFLVIGKTSPVTYQVLGHLKTCLVLGFGYTLLNDPFTERNIIGISVAVLGMGFYSYFCSNESKKKTSMDSSTGSQIKDKEILPLSSTKIVDFQDNEAHEMKKGSKDSFLFQNDVEIGNLENIDHGTNHVILDPEGKTVRAWNKVFLVMCLVSLFVDPLFFLLPYVDEAVICIVDENVKVKLLLTVMRSVADVLYAVQIYVKFRTAYAVPLSSTSVFGRGSLEFQPLQIALNYLRNGFFIDLFVALPVPQVMIWGLIPNLSGSKTSAKYVFLFVMICQYLPRLFLIFPLSSQIMKSAGVITQTAWAGAAYNLMLSILASHVLGASWFLQAIARQEQCWQYVCALETQSCQYSFFDCSTVDDIARKNWYMSSNISNVCNPGKNQYPFGIFGEALTSKVTSSPFLNRYFYSLWWGLKNLSSLGQGLLTSTFIGEIVFAIVIGILGLVLFALLISNMQVPLFAGMDEMIQDLIIEKLKPALYTKGALLVREGHPVSEVIFIIRGHLNTTAGQPVGFNSQPMGQGDFCGDGLLHWSIDPHASLALPISPRTVEAVSEVEAFAITAQDLRLVGIQTRLHQDQFRHRFRFHSHQWRTWAACFIQRLWRRHRNRRSIENNNINIRITVT